MIFGEIGVGWMGGGVCVCVLGGGGAAGGGGWLLIVRAIIIPIRYGIFELYLEEL